MKAIFVGITFRQRAPNGGADLPLDKCETQESGPFTTREAAERFATSTADTTPVYRVVFTEKECAL